jgi:phosphate transport system substrate-binding protein
VKKIIKAAIISAAACLISMAASCGGGSETAVIVAGSTSVQPYVEMLAEEYKGLYDKNADVQGGGSSAGIQAVESGIADIGMSSRALRESEWQTLWSVEIARDGLAIIIHPENPVKDLTIREIQGIYTGEIDNWRALGGTDAKIHVFAREEGSGTRSAFEELVMSEKRVTLKAMVMNSNGAVRQSISADKNSIGFISLGLVDDTVSAISLNGTEASWANVMDGEYALFRSFLFVTREEPEGDAKQFIDFVLSPGGQRLLTDEGLIPSAGGE